MTLTEHLEAAARELRELIAQDSTIQAQLALDEIEAALRDGPPGGEPSLYSVIAWLKKRPGASWMATIQDIEQAVAEITKAGLRDSGGAATP